MWINVKDKLPIELCDQVIVCNYVPSAPEPMVVLCAVFYKDKFYQIEQWQSDRDADSGEVDEIKHVTHWMPLPAPPTAKTTEGANLHPLTQQCGEPSEICDCYIRDEHPIKLRFLQSGGFLHLRCGRKLPHC